MKSYYRTTDVAEMLGVSTTTVYTWLSEGKLRRHTDSNRHVHITKESLDAFLEKHPKYKARRDKKNEHDLYIEEKLKVFEELHVVPTNTQLAYMKSLKTDVQIDNFALDLILGRTKVK
jgi:excisionase family DNA binding protein